MSTFTGIHFDGERATGLPVTGEFTAEGQLRLSGEGLGREFALGDVRVSDRLGQVPRFLYLPDGGVIESSDNDAIDDALAVRRRSRAARLIHFLESQQRIAAAACLGVVVAVAAFVYFGLPVLARTVAAGVPPDIDQRIGQVTLTAIAPYFSASALRPEERRRVEKQLERLRPTGQRPRLEFRSMRGGLPNAFALPGGMIVVTDELVRLPADDDEIAAVLAHELGHLERRHGVRSLLERSFALLVVAAVTGDVSTLTSVAATIPISLLTAGYSRDLEREADQFALALLRERGIPPHAFALILAKLEDAQVSLQRNSTYVSTHPATEERTALFGGLSAGDRKKLKTGPLENSARSALSRGDLDDAIEACDELIELTPTAAAHLLRARCRLERDEIGPARQDLDAALALDPEVPDRELLHIELLLYAGDLPAAARAARELLEREPRNALARGLLGYALDTPDDHAAARRELDAALKLDRTHPRLWYWRSVVLFRSGEKETAATDLENALGLDPGYTRARFRRAQVRDEQRKYNEVLTDLAALSGPASRTAEYFLLRARAEAQTGQAEKARQNYGRGLELEPAGELRTDLLFGRGALLLNLKRWSEALTDLDTLVALKPEQGTAHLMRATALRYVGLPEEALRAIDRAEAAGAADFLVLRERVETHFDAGNFEAAFTAAERLVAVRRDAIALRAHGLIQLARAEWSGAEEDLVAALKLNRRKNDEYSEFFLLLARRRGQQPEQIADFTATVATWRLGWGKLIGQYLSQQIPAARLLAEAETGGVPNRKERLCEAHYYIGITELLAGQRDAARVSLEKSVATGVRNYYEHRLARAELARLHRE